MGSVEILIAGEFVPGRIRTQENSYPIFITFILIIWNICKLYRSLFYSVILRNLTFSVMKRINNGLYITLYFYCSDVSVTVTKHLN